MRRKDTFWAMLVVMALVVAVVPAWVSAAPPAQEPGVNLLQNPGFEGISCDPSSAPGWCEGNWTHDTLTGVPYGNIFTPQGWITYWTEGVNPIDPSGRHYGRPECKVIPNAAPFVGPPARVRSGSYGVLQFGFFRAIDSGLLQTVSGLVPGAAIQFSAYGHAWSCDGDDPFPYSCGDQYNMLLQVGIDPNGGRDPWSSSVVWASGYSYDQFRLIGPVRAQVGESGTVTVFLRATAKWPYVHNDVYWDDASLVYTEPPATPTNTPLPPPPTNTPGPSPTPLPPPTPRPDGAVVHVVQPGDTVFGIAIQYGVTVEQIEALNAGSIGADRMIWTGQELVIAIAEATATPPPTEAPTAEASPPSGTGSGGSICVLAFHDRNADTFRQTEEELLPNAVVALADDSGPLGQYQTDGLSEPYCFEGLAPSTYRVTAQLPAGYAATTPLIMAVGLTGDMSVQVALGAERDTTVPAEEGEGEEEPPVDGGESVWSQVLRWGARISGIVLLVLAVVVAVLFFLSRRQR